jgi:hypothetical protein
MALAIESAGSYDEYFRTIVDISREYTGDQSGDIQQVAKPAKKSLLCISSESRTLLNYRQLYKLKTRYESIR